MLIGALINRLISDYWVALFRYWDYLLVEIRLLEAFIGENFTYEKLCFTYEMFCYWNHLLEKFLPMFWRAQNSLPQESSHPSLKTRSSWITDSRH